MSEPSRISARKTPTVEACNANCNTSQEKPRACVAVCITPTEESGGHPGYRQLLGERLALHVEKSSGYGTGADPFANFTAVADLTGQPRYVYPVHRAIEKLTRCLNLIAKGRESELGEEFMDVASLMDCAEAMRREDSAA